MNIKKSLLLLTLLLIGCAESRTAALKTIVAAQGEEKVELEVINSGEIAGETKYFLAAGQNLHVMSDCRSLEELNLLLDTEAKGPLDPIDLAALVHSENPDEIPPYVLRSELSCQGKFPPRDFYTTEKADESLYFDQDTYYFTTGEAGEYYALDTNNSSCAFDFVSKAFRFEERMEQVLFNRPADLEKSIHLSCRNFSRTHYRLYTFAPAPGQDKIPFKGLVVLSYQRQTPDGPSVTQLPIARIDGELFNLESTKAQAVIASLQKTFQVTEVLTLPKGDFIKTLNHVVFDYCSGNCSQYVAKHAVFSLRDAALLPLTETPVYNSFPDLNLNAAQAVDARWTAQDRLRLVGCESDLNAQLGIKAADSEWFPSLRKQLLGQLTLDAPVFECPSLMQPRSCDKVLDKTTYTLTEFFRYLTDKRGCPADANTLRVRLDSDVLVEGADPLTLSRTLGYPQIVFETLAAGESRSFTYRYVCSSREKCVPTGPNNELKTIVVTDGQQLTFRDVDLKIAINGKTFLNGSELSPLKFSAFEVVDGARLNLLRSRIVESLQGSRNLWNRGVRLISTVLDDAGNPLPDNRIIRSRFTCADCSIHAEGTGLELNDGMGFVRGTTEATAQVKAKGLAFDFRGGSEAVFFKSTLEGATVGSIGYRSRAYVKNNNLTVTGKITEKPVNAFSFTTKASIDPFVLDIQSSKIYGLPTQQLSSFLFSDFRAADGTGKFNLNKMELYRGLGQDAKLVGNQDLGLILRCAGKGGLVYQLKNYCPTN